MGLHLMIFDVESLAGKGGALGIFYGTMLVFLGASVGGTYAMYHTQYGGILKRINRLLKAD